MALREFHNIYFVLRHGESIPNTRGVILSDPAEGAKPENTLTPHGEEQVRASVEAAKAAERLDDHTIIFSSPFSRCRRTAEIAKEILGADESVVFDDRLRERWFGDWEGTSNANYEKVWAGDTDDPHYQKGHVESSADVTERTIALIGDLEKRYKGRTILLVSHGDVIHILKAYFSGHAPNDHRVFPNIGTGELQQL